MKSLRVVLLLVAGLLIVGPVLANPVPPWVAKMTKGLTLTPEQKAKLEAVKKEFGPKAPPINAKLGAAAKKLSAAANTWPTGTKLKVLEEAITQVDEATKAAVALEKDVHDAVMAVLTAEQREQLQRMEGSKKEKTK